MIFILSIFKFHFNEKYIFTTILQNQPNLIKYNEKVNKNVNKQLFILTYIIILDRCILKNLSILSEILNQHWPPDFRFCNA